MFLLVPRSGFGERILKTLLGSSFNLCLHSRLVASLLKLGFKLLFLITERLKPERSQPLMTKHRKRPEQCSIQKLGFALSRRALLEKSDIYSYFLPMFCFHHCYFLFFTYVPCSLSPLCKNIAPLVSTQMDGNGRK